MVRFGLATCALLLLAACAAGPTGRATAPVAAAPPLSPDQDFLNRAATGTGNEVALGRLAGERGLAGPVRTFGAHIAAEHARLNARLIDLARRLNMAPNATTADLSGLAALSGPEFDRQFIADQIRDQREALALFETGAQAVQDPRLRHFAREWLPTLRRDLTRAERIGSQYGVAQAEPPSLVAQR